MTARFQVGSLPISADNAREIEARPIRSESLQRSSQDWLPHIRIMQNSALWLDRPRPFVREGHNRPLRIYPGALREDAAVANAQIAEAAHPQLGVNDAD